MALATHALCGATARRLASENSPGASPRRSSFFEKLESWIKLDAKRASNFPRNQRFTMHKIDKRLTQFLQ
jgi:hypothetical protein